jgi:hypothetical protein
MEFADCWWSAIAASAWIAKISDSHSVASVLEHNSMLVYLAQMRDMIADPSKTATAMADTTTPVAAGVARPANNGRWWTYASYYGPAPYTPAQMTAATTAGTTLPLVTGIPRPVFGTLARPTADATRLSWWEALAELEYEIGNGWTSLQPATALGADPTDGEWVGVRSDAAQAVIPVSRVPQIPGVEESGTVKTLLYNTATAQADILTAATAYVLRLKTAALDPSAAPAVSALEQSVAPLVQQLSQAYEARFKTANLVTGGAFGLAALGAGLKRLARR